jgi:hypothetical protein
MKRNPTIEKRQSTASHTRMPQRSEAISGDENTEGISVIPANEQQETSEVAPSPKSGPLSEPIVDP